MERSYNLFYCVRISYDCVVSIDRPHAEWSPGTGTVCHWCLITFCSHTTNVSLPSLCSWCIPYCEVPQDFCTVALKADGMWEQDLITMDIFSIIVSSSYDGNTILGSIGKNHRSFGIFWGFLQRYEPLVESRNLKINSTLLAETSLFCSQVNWQESVSAALSYTSKLHLVNITANWHSYSLYM